MRWPHALVYLAVAAILVTVTWLTAPPPAPPPTLDAPHADSTLAVREVVVDAHGTHVRAVRVGERWQVREPQGSTISSDLISALLTTVLDGRAEAVAGGDADQLGDFGLAEPSARIVLTRDSGAPVTLVLGATNPSATGIYGRLEGNPQIVLLGLNVHSYVDLLTQ